jgi:hypothetical protein
VPTSDEQQPVPTATSAGDVAVGGAVPTTVPTSATEPAPALAPTSGWSVPGGVVALLIVVLVIGGLVATVVRGARLRRWRPPDGSPD